MDSTFEIGKTVFNYRVAGVLIKNNHILLHRQGNDTYWALPGGRVQVKEDSKTAVEREMEEELGVEVKAERLLWMTENFFQYREQDFHEIGLYYALSSSQLLVKEEEFFGEEGERLVYRWVPLNELHEMNVKPSFLKDKLIDLPASTKHLIINDYK
ncbi:NUDIX hydrolase [Jeotgalibacillus proteolyticus]|uniref:NUDIX hydrolase n=1 Tax=Jeotgalibacillus proteolyticus TaxID=2082395 RepID=A0A2S5GDG4_9BACL|nr:NUDIX hydrolase [Jeotgalibacillus proteolyticus]PPA70965.1 NUDIX hydrolase [Jeotgalibacillus proteolyticus]